MKSTLAMRVRARELATPPRDDYDRAVLAMLDDFTEGVMITGIHLLKESGCAVVLAEIDGRWVEVIRENAAAPFSHIVEVGGLRKALRDRAPAA